jgi:hypothetical protein
MSDPSETKQATLPASEAFNLEALLVTFGSGETHELVVVDSDRVDDDAYVDGQHGSRVQPLTLEGPGAASADLDGTYVYHGTVLQKKGSDTATVHLELAPDLYPDQSVTVEAIESVSIEGDS